MWNGYMGNTLYLPMSKLPGMDEEETFSIGGY
jgi:hypothetical protein